MTEAEGQGLITCPHPGICDAGVTKAEEQGLVTCLHPGIRDAGVAETEGLSLTVNFTWRPLTMPLQSLLWLLLCVFVCLRKGLTFSQLISNC